MARVRLGHAGAVEVLEPPTPEEAAEAEIALQRVIQALAELMVERDFGLREADGPPS